MAYGPNHIRRIPVESALVVEINFTWSLRFGFVELGRLPNPLSSTSVEAHISLIMFEFSSCLFVDSAINLVIDTPYSIDLNTLYGSVENVIAEGFENRPPMLEKRMYDSWKTQIMLYIKGKENGDMLLDSIKNGTFKLEEEITVKDTDGVTNIKLPQTTDDIAPKERFVTAAKQARDLHVVNFDQLYAFLKHNKKDAKEVQEMRQRFPDPLALLANSRHTNTLKQINKR
nr:hypothetical protein [Tanacetum cinerariifolium]